MILEFIKMSGAGNDFILIDNRARRFQLSRDQVVRLCHRQHGIGADGILMLVPGRKGTAEWAWDFYNSDGSTAEMCGNGARCFARFIQRQTGARGQTTFETGAGVITADFEGEQVTVNLTVPRDLRLDQWVPVPAGKVQLHSINTGVPHAVLFVPDADQAMVQQLGAELRFHEHFQPQGTNVNFVQLIGPNSIRVRTYERGVEGETLACGTGVTASALIAARVHGLSAPINVQVQGGDRLQVHFVHQADGSFAGVKLTGPATFVFEGRIEV